jgi:hypothetical protein
VPDSPARLNADCGLGNEANRRVGEARNVATTFAQSFPKATPLYTQPQAFGENLVPAGVDDLPLSDEVDSFGATVDDAPWCRRPI